MAGISPSPKNHEQENGERSSRVLMIGGTGFIGHYIAQASVDSGRPTYILTRGSADSPVIKAFQDQGAIIIYGSISDDQEFVERILKENKIDVVISVVGGGILLDQLTLVRAIKAVGTIKRFLPSEFGHDVDRESPVEPGRTMYNQKKIVRRLIEELGVPYTYICSNSIVSWPYHDNAHAGDALPPLDEFKIYGDGSVKAYFVAGIDIGRLTIKAAHDARTLNKMVHFQPPCNYVSINDLAALWEKKIGRTLPRVTISGDDLLAAAKENIIPESIVAAFTYDIFIKGCHRFSVEAPNEMEIRSLYPDEVFRTVDQCFDEYAAKLRDMNAINANGQDMNAIDTNGESIKNAINANGEAKNAIDTNGESISATHHVVDVGSIPKFYPGFKSTA